MTVKSWFAAAALVAAALSSSGCASVPQEAVELSQAVGDDIQTVRTSYEGMIHSYFDSVRKRVDTLLTEKWARVYLTSFIKSGKLLENAKAGKTKHVEAWARVAVAAIDKKRQEEFARIDLKERELLAKVSAMFEQMTAANAAVTAHLNSVRKVQSAQDEALEILGAKDLRDQINAALVTVSNETEAAVDRIDRATEKLKDATE